MSTEENKKLEKHTIVCREKTVEFAEDKTPMFVGKAVDDPFSFSQRNGIDEDYRTFENLTNFYKHISDEGAYLKYNGEKVVFEELSPDNIMNAVFSYTDSKGEKKTTAVRWGNLFKKEGEVKAPHKPLFYNGQSVYGTIDENGWFVPEKAYLSNYHDLFEDFIRQKRNRLTVNDNFYKDSALLSILGTTLRMIGAPKFNEAIIYAFLYDLKNNKFFENRFDIQDDKTMGNMLYSFHKSMRQADIFDNGHAESIMWDIIHCGDNTMFEAVECIIFGRNMNLPFNPNPRIQREQEQILNA